MLYKRGKVYYIDFRYKGKRYRETTNETSYDKAIVIYNEFKRQLNAHTIKKGITFNEAALLFLEGKIRQGLSPQTIKKYKEHFKYFKEFFEKKTIDEIDKKAVQDYEHCKMAGGTRAEYMRIQLQ
jgi:hypothetical protein